MRTLLSILFFVLPVLGFSKNSPVDSLKNLHRLEVNSERKLELEIEIAKSFRYFNLDSALVRGSNALENAKKLKLISLQIEASIELTKAMIVKGFFDDALELTKKSLPMTMENQLYKKQADLLSLVGYIQRRKGNSTLSEQNYLECLQLSQRNDFEYGIASAKKGLGDLSERKGENQLALQYYNEALELAENLKNRELQANIINATGIIYDYQGDFEEAMQFYLNALELNQKIGNFVKAAGVSSNVASLQFTLHNNSAALKYYKLSLDLAKQSFSKSMMADALQGMFVVYNDLEQMTSAADCAFRDLQLRQEMGDKRGLAFSYKNVGIYYFKLKEYAKAVQYFKKGLEYAIETDQKRKSMVLYLELGRVTIQRKNAFQAIDYLERGLKLSEELEMNREKALFYDHLSICHAMIGNLDATYKYRQFQKDITDLLSSEAIQKASLEIEAIYETKLKNEQISNLENETELQGRLLSQSNKVKTLSFIGLGSLVLLSFLFYNRSRLKQKSNLKLLEKNAEIESQSRIIAESLEEKEVLLREIHHRVKNNLQIISSLLNLQSKKISDQALLDSINEGKNRVEAMSLIHQNLYQNEGLTSIAMQKYLEQLMDHLSTSFRSEDKKIEFEIKANKIVFDIDTAIPLGLIVNELVSNAYKHAFKNKEEGTIKVEISQEDNAKYLLRVKDDGVGISEDINLKKSKSLGLKLVHSLGARQLKGDIQISNNKGCQFEILFSELSKKI